MFSEFPNLLGRNFITGFFMPMIIFLGILLSVVGEFGHGNILSVITQNDVVLGATTIGIGAWLGGILLAVLNRSLYRAMEGYGKYNPLRIFGLLEKRRFRMLREQRKKLNREYRELLEQGQSFPKEKSDELAKISQHLTDYFPDKEEYVLPTAFGNTVRAFEVYSRVMYGIEGTTGWDRLLAVIPTDFRELIESAKTKTDFWLNLQVTCLLTLILYVVLLIQAQQFRLPWFPIATLVVLRLSYSGARSAALEWGDLIKASFDLYLPDLCKKLGYRMPIDKAEERKFWEEFSSATLYRRPDEFTFLRDSQEDSSELLKQNAGKNQLEGQDRQGTSVILTPKEKAKDP